MLKPDLLEQIETRHRIKRKEISVKLWSWGENYQKRDAIMAEQRKSRELIPQKGAISNLKHWRLVQLTPKRMLIPQKKRVRVSKWSGPVESQRRRIQIIRKWRKITNRKSLERTICYFGEKNQPSLAGNVDSRSCNAGKSRIRRGKKHTALQLIG